jgi:membrane peptidoglycan carboxypeptidase
MTYNFDPEKWYERERSMLEVLRREGKIDADEYRSALDALDRRYDEMLKRLDGSYRIPE